MPALRTFTTEPTAIITLYFASITGHFGTLTHDASDNAHGGYHTRVVTCFPIAKPLYDLKYDTKTDANNKNYCLFLRTMRFPAFPVFQLGESSGDGPSSF
jgi:hypothetical protein